MVAYVSLVLDVTAGLLFSGPGMLTRALLNLPRERIKKIVLLEPVEGFAKWLEVGALISVGCA